MHSNTKADRHSYLRRLIIGFAVWSALLSASTANAQLNALQKSLSSNHMKQLAIGIHQFHAKNNAWPDKLEDIKPLVGAEDYADIIKNPLTGDKPGYEYVKPKVEEHLSKTIFLYQLKGGKRDTTLPVGYGDGSIRDYEAPDK